MAQAAMDTAAVSQSPPPSAEADEKGAQVVEGPIVCPGHSRPVPHLAYSNIVDDRLFLTSGCLDGDAMLRDADTGDWIGTFSGHKGAVWTCRLDNTTTKAVTASADYSAKLWDAVSGEVLHTWDHKTVVRTATFTTDARFVVTGQDKIIRAFDVASTELKNETEHAFALNNIITTNDPNVVVLSGRSKNVSVFDLRNMSTVNTIINNDEVSNISLTLDGKILVVCAGKFVRFFATDSWTLIREFDINMPATCASLDATRKQFVTGSNSELWVRVFAFESGQELACYKGHHGPLRCIDVSPRGNAIASGSEDGTIRLWDWPK